METVSVIIVTFNTRELTLKAIESVYASIDGCPKEIVVVDNGSTDDTERAVHDQFPAVRYCYSKTNLGFAKANNLGAQESTGAWILLLNSDARLKPDSLKIALPYMHANPKCGILGAQLLNDDGSRQNSVANYPTPATELLSKSLLRRLMPDRFPGKENRLTDPTKVESVIGAFLLTPRALWREIGGLDERYFFFLEETDYCLQVQRKGRAVIHHPKVEVWHSQGSSAKKVKAAARIEYWRSRYQYFAKNASTVDLRILQAGLLFRLLLNWILNGTATLLTFGAVSSLRNRFAIAHALTQWHLQGQPKEWGIPREARA